ncbi:hypothetical protein SDC9_65586 [bioreactor metagenome]|uniref:Uncharacterized protein n=1 Tax=bioreactor metagenome TaxID=1076179 RepID=A0A644XTS2_9ZZZZ
MPGNRLALPIRVGGEKDLSACLRRAAQLGNHILLALNRLVIGDKTALYINAQLALRQIADMAHGGLHQIAGA